MNLGVLVSGRGSNLRNLLDLYFPVVAVATANISETGIWNAT
jgi:folate-dependent phosphoribosylglycinamide formyltransferase PurN